MSIRILLLGEAENCKEIRKHLRDQEFTIVGAVESDDHLIDEINDLSPDIVLVTDIDRSALRACHQIYLLRPRSIAVVIGDNGDAEIMKELMEAGVHYVISPDTESFQFISELKAIYTNETNRIQGLESTGTSAAKSKVITVFGTKDGVGKTSLAVNLAVKLAENKNKVVVLDYDMQFGDIATYFGMNTKDTLTELLNEQPNPNVDSIRQFLTLHISGVSFLAAPFSPEDGECITVSQLEKIVSALRIYYDYVIIDAPSGFSDISTLALDYATQILFVTADDIGSLRNTKKAISILRVFTNMDKIKLIVGRKKRYSIKTESIEKALDMKVWSSLPEDIKPTYLAANQGIPFVNSYPKSRISKAVEGIAKDIDIRKPDKREKSGFFKKIGKGTGK